MGGYRNDTFVCLLAFLQFYSNKKIFLKFFGGYENGQTITGLPG